MKRNLILLLSFFACCNVHAQTYVATWDTSKTLTKVDVNPQPIGGTMLQFNRYVVMRGQELLKPGHAAGLMKAQIFIEKDGKVSNPVITMHLSPELDSATATVLRSCPLWKPGAKNGANVRTLIRVSLYYPRGQQQLAPVRNPDARIVTRQDADVAIDEPITAVKPDEGDPNKIYTSVEQVPAYPGGLNAFLKFIDDNNKLKGKDTEGRGRVIVTFVVERDGSITGIKVARGIGTEFDAEALRLMKLMPKWKPGIQNGRTVRVQYSVPVSFVGQ